jgi:Tat protein secretion system quality control protein TatD with DNase activity
MFQLEQHYPNNCFAMMGLHPCHVKEGWEQELDELLAWFDKITTKGYFILLPAEIIMASILSLTTKITTT